MHFYTYDDWIAHAYSTTDQKDLSKGQTKVIDVTGKLGKGDDQFRRINIFSRHTPVVSVKSDDTNPSFDFYSSTVNCDLGCLYKIKDKYKQPTPSKYNNLGCIQPLDNAFGSEYPDASQWPYIFLIDKEESKLYPNLKGAQCLTINVENSFEKLEKILVFQSIYSGCISYPEAQSSLEIQFGEVPGTINWNPDKYDYKINTNLYSATSLMIVGALITFDISGQQPNQQYNLIIQNISEFVYGHVDMAERFGWNKPLWRCFVPPKDAKVMKDSIMHYSKS